MSMNTVYVNQQCPSRFDTEKQAERRSSLLKATQSQYRIPGAQPRERAGRSNKQQGKGLCVTEAALRPRLVGPPVCFSVAKAAGTRLLGSKRLIADWPVWQSGGAPARPGRLPAQSTSPRVWDFGWDLRPDSLSKEVEGGRSLLRRPDQTGHGGLSCFQNETTKRNH